MKQNDPVVITSFARTPMGQFQGALANVTASQLGATAISAAIKKANIKPSAVEEVIMGCVLSAGQGQAPARQAAIGAGIPNTVGCSTLNKMCGSGMKAMMFAHDLLLVGDKEVMLAGGLESMSNAPYLLAKARSGYRLGHAQLIDHMLLDGLEDAYEKGCLMGEFADRTASRYAISREVQDQFAIESLQRAQKAIAQGDFVSEIAAVTVQHKKQTRVIDTDELPKANVDKIPTLRPAFSKEGTVTAANASCIADGAAALILMRQSVAEKKSLTPAARIVAHSCFAHEPAWFTTAPVGAIRQLLDKIDWRVNDVDLFEINEAFAVVTLVAMHELDIPHEKVNIHGGACALGHPIGASGARIVVSLLAALEKYQLKRGIAALCIGGGEATAIAIERIE